MIEQIKEIIKVVDDLEDDCQSAEISLHIGNYICLNQKMLITLVNIIHTCQKNNTM